MRVIVMNSSNLVQDGQNNKLIYKFPNSVVFKNNSIAVSSVSMYYSWFNISQALGNNTFTYSWTNGTTVTTYQVVIPDGLYEIAQLNSYLQFVMISNDTYLIDSSGKYVYCLCRINIKPYTICSPVEYLLISDCGKFTFWLYSTVPIFCVSYAVI